eukprot:m.671621 g.671621  ORF g.671621 m.671621 type:complete len:85 (+) comp22775_c0_seq3:991-1245(+)
MKHRRTTMPHNGTNNAEEVGRNPDLYLEFEQRLACKLGKAMNHGVELTCNRLVFTRAKDQSQLRLLAVCKKQKKVQKTEPSRSA